jgi:hypothetical protein
MTPKRLMSVKEGWKDVRRRLPSMNRAFARHRNARMAVRDLRGHRCHRFNVLGSDDQEGWPAGAGTFRTLACELSRRAPFDIFFNFHEENSGRMSLPSRGSDIPGFRHFDR